MKAKQSCRTCVYWDKPAKDRALSGRVYPCSAPMPPLKIPDSVRNFHSFTPTPFRKFMERDEGTSCACWSVEA